METKTQARKEPQTLPFPTRWENYLNGNPDWLTIQRCKPGLLSHSLGKLLEWKLDLGLKEFLATSLSHSLGKLLEWKLVIISVFRVFDHPLNFPTRWENYLNGN